MLSDPTLQAIKDSVETKLIEIDGVAYATRQVYLPPVEPDDPMPDTLTLHTLSGVVEFAQLAVNANRIEAIHVLEPNDVRVLGPLEGSARKRPLYARAVVRDSKFPFGSFQSIEDFVIGVQAAFLDTTARAELLAYVGNVRDEVVRTSEDDGVTQIATVKKGVSMQTPRPVPNPVKLAPFRTFVEIAQPESAFILRLKRKEGELPMVALFETADRGWEIEAIKLIRQFLADALPEVPIIA